MFKFLPKLFVSLVWVTGLVTSHPAYSQDSTYSNKKHFQVNLTAGGIISNSFSDLSWQDWQRLKSNRLNETTKGYQRDASTPISFGLATSAELLYGTSVQKVLPVFSLDYTLSSAAMIKDITDIYAVHNFNKRTRDSLEIKRRFECLGISFGALFKVEKKLSVSSVFYAGHILRQKEVTNGFSVSEEHGYSTTGLYYKYDSLRCNQMMVTDRTPGLRLICGIRFTARYTVTNHLCAFVTRNLGIGYKIPWWMIGVQFYPFRRLR